MEITGLPKTMENAIDVLLVFYDKAIPEIFEMDEETFMGSSHFGAGMFIRNSWYLWWYKNHGYKEWPEEQPELNKWFESIGITHADDMSGILLTCLYRKIHNLNFNIEDQVEKYQEHWKQCGYKDGIPKHD